MELAGPICGSKWSATLLAFWAVMPLAFAQNAAPTATGTTPAKFLAFDVVSIRPSKPGTNQSVRWGTTPDGYRVTGQSLWATIMVAYFPQGMAYWSGDRLSGAPSWINDQYDIDAKVSEADLAEWQKQGKALDQEPMLHQMLQSMLADRCHLLAHVAPGPPVSGWSLELTKRGDRITESKPDESLPQGVTLLSGGVMVPGGQKHTWSFYGATMADFATVLSQSSAGHPVQDHTRLPGRYDFVVSFISDPEHPERDGMIPLNDPDPLSHWNIEALGFRRVSIKLPANTLVIDHIERPSEN